MQQITELKPTKLLAVIIPYDSFDFKTEYDDKYTSLYLKRKSLPDNNPFSDEALYEEYHFECVLLETNRNLPIPKIKIIGSISNTGKFDFDCRKLIESKKHPMFSYTVFRHYNINNSISWINIHQQSFISLLELNGILLKNPIEKPNIYDYGYSDDVLWQSIVDAELYEKRLSEYESYQSKVLQPENKIIILEKQ